MRVIDPVGAPSVEFAVGCADDVEAMVDRLAELLEREEHFAVSLRGPTDLADWHALLWDAQGARRRLRRMRPALAAWCDRVEVAVADPAVTEPAGLRLLGLAWGCETRAVAAA